jgi:hypothetical protein
VKVSDYDRDSVTETDVQVRDIFADADTIARRKVRRRAIILSGERWRNDVTGSDLRTRCPRSTVQGRLAPTWVVSAHSQYLNFLPCHNPQPEYNLRGIFANADAV